MKPLFLLFAILFASPLLAADVPIQWDAVTASDLAGYKAYRSATPVGTNGKFASPVVVTLGKVTTYTWTGLADGTHYFAVTAFDTSGNESAYSNVVPKTIDSTPPEVPPNLRIVSQAATNITGSAAHIAWRTSVPADGIVRYGPTLDLGRLATADSTRQTDHFVRLSGLAGKAQYWYRVESKDEKGNLVVSEMGSFRTK
jgi:hypothetical protein